MATVITDIPTLTDEVLAFVNREGDTALEAKVPVFIDLLEGILRRKLRNKAQKAALALDSGFVTLPTAVKDLRHVRLNTGTASNDWTLLPRTIDQLSALRQRFPNAGKPRYYAILNRQLHLVPVPDASYTSEIVYLEAYTPVSSSAALISEAPDLYFYGVLAELGGYLEHEERVSKWEAARDAAIAELNNQREAEELAMTSRQAQRLPRVFGERP